MISPDMRTIVLNNVVTDIVCTLVTKKRLYLTVWKH